MMLEAFVTSSPIKKKNPPVGGGTIFAFVTTHLSHQCPIKDLSSWRQMGEGADRASPAGSLPPLARVSAPD